MTTSLEQLSSLLREEDEKNSNNGKRSSNTGDNASYPFWNAPKNTTSIVRFLPDGDSNNPFFWVKREIIKLPFDGQVGGDYPTDNKVTVTVPCMKMWGENCPITTAINPWWKESEDKKALARIYYRKRTYLFQGFVVSSAFEEENLPENPIRRLLINQSIFDIIKGSLINPEMEKTPIDYQEGRDFKITKTMKPSPTGEYANYSTSTWSIRTRALNEEEMLAIETYKLFNLSQFLGQKPDADGVAMIKAMFDDSLAGKPFDFDSYGKVYTAYGARNNNTHETEGNTKVASKASSMMHEEQHEIQHHEEVEEEVHEESSHAKPNAAEILAKLRKKTQA